MLTSLMMKILLERRLVRVIIVSKCSLAVAPDLQCNVSRSICHFNSLVLLTIYEQPTIEASLINLHTIQFCSDLWLVTLMNMFTIM